MKQAIDEAAKALARLMDSGDDRKAEVEYGTVTKVDKGTVYVLMDGSDTPVAARSMMASKAGDRVRVSVSNHALVVTGNATAPATDDAAADAAQAAADDAQAAAEAASVLVYDHEYSLDDGIYTFTAHVTKAGEDVTHEYPEELFVWTLKTEQGERDLGTGYSIQVPSSMAEYRATVIGQLADYAVYDIADHLGNVIVTADGNALGAYVNRKDV